MKQSLDSILFEAKLGYALTLFKDITVSRLLFIKCISIDYVSKFRLYGPCPQYSCIEYGDLCFSVIPYVFNERYFEVLFHVKCFNSALRFIHVCNELCQRACTSPPRGQVCLLESEIPPRL